MRHTILVVDDDPSVRRLVSLLADSLGDVHVAADAAEALAFTDHTVPDAVILDVTMPGMTGLELLTTWRADDRTAHMAVCILSARDSADDIAAGYDSGTDLYIAKPFNPEVLVEMVRMVLNDPARKRAELLAELAAL